MPFARFAVIIAVLTALALPARAQDPAPIRLRADLYRTNAAGTVYSPLRQKSAFEVEVTLLDAAIDGTVLHSERLQIVPLSRAKPSAPGSGQINVPGKVYGPVELVLGSTESAPLPSGLLGTDVWFTTQVIIPKSKGEKVYGRSPTQRVPAQALAADLLRYVRMVELPIDDLGNTVRAIRFEGINVQVVNGLGATNGDPADPLNPSAAGATVNGLGNLIVGYNELREAPASNDRSGSHTLIIGQQNNCMSFGGLLAGRNNTISGRLSSVSGGRDNIASGEDSVVGGGWNNVASGGSSSVSGGRDGTASGFGAAVSGGRNNTASGSDSSVSGGSQNTASGYYAAVSGGVHNTANNTYTSVSGGSGNVASGNHSSVSGGEANIASGQSSSVSGGYDNVGSGLRSSVSGGEENTASHEAASVSGGNANDATAYATSISGGRFNEATEDYASISGGKYNTASGMYTSVSGGEKNVAIGWRSSITGGYENTANGPFASVNAGRGNNATGNYTAVNGGRLNSASADYATVGGGWSKTAWGIDDWVAGILWTDG